MIGWGFTLLIVGGALTYYGITPFYLFDRDVSLLTLIAGILLIFWGFYNARKAKKLEESNEEDRVARIKENQRIIFDGAQGAANILSLGVLSDGEATEKELRSAIDTLESFYYLFSENLDEFGEAKQQLYWDDEYQDYEALAKKLAHEHLKGFQENVKTISDKDIPAYIFSDKGHELLKESAKAIKATYDLVGDVVERQEDGTTNMPSYYVLSDLAKILGADFEFGDTEVAYFKLVIKELDFTDDYDSLLKDVFQDNKKTQLSVLEKIPTVTKKISDFISEEFEDLNEITKISEAELRDKVPGLSKAAASAIIKKLSAFYVISEKIKDE